MKKTNLLLASLILLFSCCQDDLQEEENRQNSMAQTRSLNSVTPETFDWDNADWMPTPSGQNPIPTPWVGQGSLASTYDAEILNDRKNSDGWELLYSTFSSKGSASLVNPYFALYNKYRGVMRIFLYLTTPFITTSNYITSNLSVLSNHSTNILNLLGNEIIDGTQNKTLYSQVLPCPQDGSSPLATNRWYMMEYELSYDGNLADIPCNEIQLNWSLDFCNITDFNFEGASTGTIKSAVGANSKLTSSIKEANQNIVKGVLGGIGLNLLKKNKLDDNGKNNMGIPSKIFKNIFDGATKMVNGAQSGLLSSAAGILNAILFKSTNNPLNLTIDMDIKMSGNSSAQGALPSTPISFWVPGTDFSAPATGYIPLYNKLLGVVGIGYHAPLRVNTKLQTFINTDVPTAFRAATFDMTHIYRKYKYWDRLHFNPEVKKIADIKHIALDLLMIPGENMKYTIHEHSGMEPYGENGNMFLLPAKFSHIIAQSSYDVPHDSLTEIPFTIVARYTFEIIPKDGSPSTIMTKSLNVPLELSITELSDEVTAVPDKDIIM